MLLKQQKNVVGGGREIINETFFSENEKIMKIGCKEKVK